MNRIAKFFLVTIAVLTLVSFSVIPALAATYYYSSGRLYYSYPGGSYSTRFGQIPYQRPTPTPAPAPKPTPAPTPAPAPKPTPAPAPSPAPKPAPSTGMTAEEAKMVNLVNQERTSRGITALSVNAQLVTLARMKSQDMVAKNYFDHTSPTYGDPFTMMRNYGVQYRTAGENLAGAATTESAHQNLMNSSGHRANILNTSFTQVGIGIAQGSMYGNIFTQMFIGL